MNDRAYSFLIGVLGKDGAHAFKKAIDREASLGGAVVPRAIMSWLNIATKYDYTGGIPGVSNTYLSFKKSETGLDGGISVGEEVYSFSGASAFHVAASVAVALGVENASANVRDQTLAKVGKSIDTLVKARIITEQLMRKGAAKDLLRCDCKTDPHLPACATRMKKVDLPGTTAKPKDAQMAFAPQAPMAPNSQKQKPAPFKVTKSESDHKCSMCQRSQFANGGFVGCLCFRDMAGAVRVAKTEAGYSLTFASSEWDIDAVAALRAALRG